MDRLMDIETETDLDIGLDMRDDLLVESMMMRNGSEVPQQAI